MSKTATKYVSKIFQEYLPFSNFAILIIFLVPKWQTYWPLVFVWNFTPKFAAILEKPEQWEPVSWLELGTVGERLAASQGMVIEKETRGYVESDEHIDGVVFVCS